MYINQKHLLFYEKQNTKHSPSSFLIQSLLYFWGILEWTVASLNTFLVLRMPWIMLIIFSNALPLELTNDLGVFQACQQRLIFNLCQYHNSIFLVYLAFSIHKMTHLTYAKLLMMVNISQDQPISMGVAGTSST